MTFYELIRVDAARYSPKKVNLLVITKLFFLETGFFVSFLYRLQRVLVRFGVLGLVFVKLIELISRLFSSCYISYRSNIQGGLFLPHPTGIVIGEGAEIQQDCTIFQNVTIGQKNGHYPRLKNKCTLYPGCVVIGDIELGEGAVVGPNSVVIESLKSEDVLVAAKSKLVRKEEDKNES